MEVKHLVTRFYTQEGIVYAVNDVSYTLEEGETLGVVGESGSGKSVHALSIMRLIPSPPGKIENGEVIFNGKDLMKLSNDEMRSVRGAEIAMIFQDPMTSLNPVLTIGTQITESLKLHKGMNDRQADDRAVELLTLVGIPDARRRLKSFPHQFSGGMRQRVMIAMALACKPTLLIADEPTTALDVTVQAQVLDLLIQLKETRGLSILLITHAMGVVAENAQHVAVMYAGHVVETAPVLGLFDAPTHPYTKGLLASIPGSQPAAATGASRRLTTVRDIVERPGAFDAVATLAGQSAIPWWPGGVPSAAGAHLGAQLPEHEMVEISADHFVRCWKPT